MENTSNLDVIDRHILKKLQENNRITIKEMAAELNLSTTPIFERMKKLEREGFITQNVAILNPEKLDLNLVVFISISISDHSIAALDEFIDQVVQFPEVLECHHVTGQSDFLLKVILKDIKEYNEFVLSKISTVPNIAKVESSFSLSVRKHTQALPIE
ncbi:MAG: Lrp/AsnC family transcriptional regulator [Bacteroidota bacterium]